MIRSCLLFALLWILSTPVLAEDTRQVLDIPASESSDNESLSSEDNIILEDETILNSIHKLEEDDKNKKNTELINNDKLIKNNIVILQGLNKVIGRVSRLEIPIGTLDNFENLEIIVHKCWESSPDERPENTALLEIREVKAGEAPKQIFLGWMFSSSPSISALEHPVYDITVISCEYRPNKELRD